MTPQVSLPIEPLALTAAFFPCSGRGRGLTSQTPSWGALSRSQPRRPLAQHPRSPGEVSMSSPQTHTHASAVDRPHGFSHGLATVRRARATKRLVWRVRQRARSLSAPQILERLAETGLPMSRADPTLYHYQPISLARPQGAHDATRAILDMF